MQVSEETRGMIEEARRDLRTPATFLEAQAAVWALDEMLESIVDTIEHQRTQPRFEDMFQGLEIARLLSETALNRAKYRRDLLLAEES